LETPCRKCLKQSLTMSLVIQSMTTKTSKQITAEMDTLLKTVKSNYGKVDLDVPRDRNGEFEPLVVKKNQTDISSIEDQVLSMYAKGMSTHDIERHVENLYGIDTSP